ncbi:MAG: protein translocase SEC61 complex subunit gamma [Promethearchaeota archaeon]|nr:MAG: protein translocase SEC61 complex subunit gamma [Candidatus Lokiarchaeota archaeon]
MANFIQNLVKKFKNFLKNAKKVIKLSRKPTLHEFRMITRICILGVLVIGFIGYAIQMIFHFVLNPFFYQMGAGNAILIELILKSMSIALFLI